MNLPEHLWTIFKKEKKFKDTSIQTQSLELVSEQRKEQDNS